MKLTTNALLLLKHILSYTGETEVGPQGNDVLSARKLNGEESSQRRSFFKNTEKITTEHTDFLRAEQDKVTVVQNKLKEELKKEFPKLEAEKDDEYETKIVNKMLVNDKLTKLFESVNKTITEAQLKVQEFEVAPKTQEVLKKYFVKYGDDCGYMPADDNSVSEIEEALK